MLTMWCVMNVNRIFRLFIGYFIKIKEISFVIYPKKSIFHFPFTSFPFTSIPVFNPLELVLKAN